MKEVLNFTKKALRAGAHCGEGELCPWGEPTQAENPAVAGFFLALGKKTA